MIISLIQKLNFFLLFRISFILYDKRHELFIYDERALWFKKDWETLDNTIIQYLDSQLMDPAIDEHPSEVAHAGQGEPRARACTRNGARTQVDG